MHITYFFLRIPAIVRFLGQYISTSCKAAGGGIIQILPLNRLPAKVKELLFSFSEDM